jgi:hypothetical protein
VILTHDFCNVLNLRIRSELFLSKIIAILLGIASVILATMDYDLLPLVFMTQSFYIPVIDVPLIMAVMGFKSSTRAVLIGMAASLITVFIWRSSSYLMGTGVDSILPATIVNLIFLGLGLLLTIYAEQNGIDAHKDKLFSTIAMNDNFGWGIGVFFLLGLIAAAYSSADSALTSLTTSFSIDILDIEKKHTPEDQIKVRKKVHIAMSLVLILVIISFNYLIGDASVITKLFVFTGYTYGPLLGLYAFGLFSKQKIKDRFVPIIAILTPFIGYAISYFSSLWFGFEFGFFILILNGLLTYLGLVLIRTQQN